MSLRALVKGWVGETMGTLAHRLLLDTRVYHSLNDVTLPSTEGTTQIDGVIWYHKQRRLFWYCTKS
jgi:hypothetical protein